MRVVLDTNVLASIVLSPEGGTLSTLYNAWGLDIFEVVISEQILFELETVFKEVPYFSSKLTEKDIKEYIKFVKQHSYFQSKIAPISIKPYEKEFSKLPNKEDYSIIAAAVRSHSVYLVTGDKAMLYVQQVQETTIITPSEFLELLYIHSLLPY